MKITKKTWLLAKPRVKIGSVVVDYYEDIGSASISLLGLENIEAVVGYDPDFQHFNCIARINGGTFHTYRCFLTGNNEALLTIDGGVTSGDVVYLVLEVDPAKTKFDQTPAETAFIIE